jgi:hypothetical protein
MKRLVITVLLGVLTAGLLAPSARAEEKPAFFAASLQEMGESRIFMAGDDTGPTMSQLGNWWSNKICSSTKDPVCDFANAGDTKETAITTQQVLVFCETATSEDCLESVEISRAGEPLRKLVFAGYSKEMTNPRDGINFPADRSMNLPEGGNQSIWHEVVDGKVSDKKYLVAYVYEMYYRKDTGKFALGTVRLIIRPFKEVATTRWDSLWTAESKSGILYDFDPNTAMQATIRLSSTAAGWYRARLTDPDIEISDFSPTNNKVRIYGKTVSVPTFVVKRKVSELDAVEKNLADSFGYTKGVVGADPGLPMIFPYMDHFRKVVGDKTTEQTTYWSLSSTTWTSQNKCLADSKRVLGIVTTNAMGYDGTAPKFEDGTLNYRVTGLHYGPDGKSLNLGTYDLLLRSDAARCLYGFSNAPISASVSITSGDGAQNVATTVVTEKDGWLKLQAAGFTFSEKTIRLKLDQAKTEAVVTPTPAATPSPIAAAPKAPAKKITIQCVKGKTVKKVTAVKPKCPSGYKKR